MTNMTTLLTMEKSTYDIYINRKRVNSYTTTTRNCEDMINIITDKYFTNKDVSFKVTKTTGKVTSIVYSSGIKITDHRKVIDLKTGSVFSSVRELSNTLKKPYPVVRIWVNGARKKITRYRFLLDNELN